MLGIFIEIFGYIGVAVTVAFVIPQIIKTYREKTAKVNMLSFYIFFAGVALWSIYGAFLASKAVHVVVANLVSLGLSTITISLLLKYSESKVLLPFIFVGVIINLVVVVLCILAIYNGWQFAHISITYIILALAASSTSFAFLPQTIQVIKTKAVRDLSIIMLGLGFMVNFIWEVYWILTPINLNWNMADHIDTIYVLLVQLFAMIIYSVQIALIIKYKEKAKPKKQKAK
ncbi:PQ-loop domain-containing transporter [Mycoplasma procyoni]|uniref:PQ-loop domain-containing transporter n=1 Tax=Mycoplasma procyoni TaxID=568784 RepID=UPI00197C0B2D|nr:PQ-loop domain-containing transporter [Mycoplasma procyoni]MBN3535075.1 hypothetical protein [Mycoplasma procyoni]